MDRVEKIRKKYGKDAFVKWGWSDGRGGSPILKAWARGKVKILKNGKKR